MPAILLSGYLCQRTHLSFFIISKNGFPFCLDKRFILNKLIIRWIALISAFIWFAGPYLADSLTVASWICLPQPNLPLTHLHLPSNPPPEPPQDEQAEIWELRKIEVRNAFGHAWSGYKNNAFPNDELSSLSESNPNKFVLFKLFYFLQIRW